MNDSTVHLPPPPPEPPVRTITRDEWRRTSRDYRSGDPRKGTATMLYYQPGVGTVLGPVKVVDGDPCSEVRFRILQSDWRISARKLGDHVAGMHDKYGTENWSTYALKGETDRHARLDAVERRACENLYRLLDLTPAGDCWRRGIGCPFVRDELTWAQASSAMPTIPERALSYGTTRRTVWCEVA
jgi:hypothetical protein